MNLFLLIFNHFMNLFQYKNLNRLKIFLFMLKKLKFLFIFSISFDFLLFIILAISMFFQFNWTLQKFYLIEKMRRIIIMLHIYHYILLIFNWFNIKSAEFIKLLLKFYFFASNQLFSIFHYNYHLTINYINIKIIIHSTAT